MLKIAVKENKVKRKTKLLSFGSLRSGEVFRLSYNNQVRFKKLSSDSYMSLIQSDEIARLDKKQIVILDL